MTIEELYDKLASKEFQKTEEGDLFYNFYLFQYPAKDEYKIREDIKEFKAKLIRPTNYVDVLTLNLFDEFCKFLDSRSFGENQSVLKFMLDMDSQEDMHENVAESLAEEANSEDFYVWIHNRIMEHINIEDDKIRPYVFMTGIGNMFPYLRTSTMLSSYEKYNKSYKYKIIVFYPGQRTDNNFRLFGLLDDKHTYRATLLINE